MLQRRRRAPTARRLTCGRCSSASSPPRPPARRAAHDTSSARERGAPALARRRKSEPPPSTKGSVRHRAAAWLREHYAEIGERSELARMLVVELETVRSAKERVKRHASSPSCTRSSGTRPTPSSSSAPPSCSTRATRRSGEARRAGRADRTPGTARRPARGCGRGHRPSPTARRHSRCRRRPCGPIASVTPPAPSRSSRRSSRGSAWRRRRSSPPGGDWTRCSSRRVAVRSGSTCSSASRRSKRTRRRGGETLARAAKLASQHGQDERATALWERRVGEDEADLEALDGLVDVLDRRGDAARLAEVLALRASAASSDEKRRADRVRRARLLGEALDEPAKAIAAWREVGRDFGDADDVALALATLLRKTRRWKDLAELLKRGADQTADEGTRAELLRQLGDVQREEMEVPGEAIETYASSLGANPRNAGARAGLMALAGEDSHGGAAVKVLLQALRASDDWRGVLELTSHRLRVASSDEERIGVLTESADIAENRAGDAGLAFEAIRRAFLLAPGREQLATEIARLAEAAGAWRSLVDAYRRGHRGRGAGRRRARRPLVGTRRRDHGDPARRAARGAHRVPARRAELGRSRRRLCRGRSRRAPRAVGRRGGRRRRARARPGLGPAGAARGIRAKRLRSRGVGCGDGRSRECHGGREPVGTRRSRRRGSTRRVAPGPSRRRRFGGGRVRARPRARRDERDASRRARAAAQAQPRSAAGGQPGAPFARDGRRPGAASRGRRGRSRRHRGRIADAGDPRGAPGARAHPVDGRRRSVPADGRGFGAPLRGRRMGRRGPRPRARATG